MFKRGLEMMEKKPLYLKELRKFTILTAIIGSLIVLFTPYSVYVHRGAEIEMYFFFYSFSFIPVLIIFLLLIIVSSFLVFRSKRRIFEITMIISAFLCFPSLIISDMTQGYFGYGHNEIFLPTFGFSFVFLIFIAVWGGYLLVRKRKLLPTEQQNKLVAT